jgi:chemotaxis protein methyltransferase CheR
VLADDPGVPMSLEEFRLIAELIHEHCGLTFREDSLHVLRRRLTPRLEAVDAPTFADYHRYLRYDPGRAAELEQVIERVTTHETYFFREPNQLEALQTELLPELHERRRRGRRLTVWSAGCSTGEEAYTAAILIAETGLFSDWDVRIFGNDLSRRVLATARRATYGRSSFRATDEARLRRWFREVDGKHVVRDEIRALVSFGHINLLDDELLSVVGDVDLVLCRNVIMYFDAPVRKRVVAAFHRRLVPGGYLLLGHSESLLNISTAFELVHLSREMVYRKGAT